MDIRPIKTDADHDAALREIERLWGASEGSQEGDRLEVLVTLVEAYERARFPTS
jgi:HTH-type transcriptional regulator/antitoxin HigA